MTESSLPLQDQLKTLVSQYNIQAKTPIAYPDSLEALEALRVFHKKELRPEHLGLHAINPGVLHNSPSRSVMMTQHLPQHLVVSGSEAPYVQTGIEYRLGEFTFSTRMPHDGVICRIIPRYARGVGSDDIKGVPEQTIIYQKESNGEYDVINVKGWECFHQYFGFKNKLTSAFHMLRERMLVPEGTKFADTPANTEDECYTYGVNFSTACMDVPGVAEDGVIISRSALKKLRVKLYETREISFGRNSFPLNRYGTKDNYKIFPDIGEEVPVDGLLMVVRGYRDFMSTVLMGPDELSSVDHTFDEKLYTRETTVGKDDMNVVKARVVDIKVIRNHDGGRVLPPTMAKQLEKYSNAYHKYFKDLLAFEAEVLAAQRRMDKNTSVEFTPALTRLLNDARAISGQTMSRLQGPIGLQYRRTPLDEYTVTFVIEHELEPREGWKLTDTNGGRSL